MQELGRAYENQAWKVNKMTLPEIPKEEAKEQIIKTCPDCGKPCKNLGVHKRYCKETKAKTAMKQEPILNAPIVLPQKTPAEPLLVISNVQPYVGADVAWFEGSDGKFCTEINYIGIVNNVPMVLVQFNDGAIIPPSSIPGFVGVLPRDSEFVEDGITQDDTEPFPPFPEEVEEPKTLLEKIEANHPDIKETYNPECKPAEKQKKSWWPFSHKKAIKPETSKPDTTDVTGLIGDAINATG
jgi:hypothetical protein